jgi:hypothetical protein
MKTFALNADLLRECNLPEAYWQLNPDTYTGDPTALDRVTAYVQRAAVAIDNSIGIYLNGPRHTQKTFLLTYALKMLLVRHFDVSYLSLDAATDLYFRERATFRELTFAPQFLGIDGINSPPENKGGGAPFVLDQIIRARKDRCRPTLLASIYAPNQLGSNYQSDVVGYVQHQCILIPTSMDPVKRDRQSRKMKEALNAD